MPGEMVTDPGAAEIVKSVPVPLRLTFCVVPDDGEPVLLSLMVSVAARAPVADGANITVMVQLALTARLPGQLLICEKSEPAKPLKPVITRGAVPVFVSVKLFGPLVVVIGTPPNPRTLVDNVANGAMAVPLAPAT